MSKLTEALALVDMTNVTYVARKDPDGMALIVKAARAATQMASSITALRNHSSLSSDQIDWIDDGLAAWKELQQ